jgi:hypothetical protein
MPSNAQHTRQVKRIIGDTDDARPRPWGCLRDVRDEHYAKLS